MEKQTRLPELDVLRFLAAIGVVFYHRARNDATMFGFLGVHLFFIISGFVILWTAIDKSVWQFVASRISRLFPSFWVCVLVTALLVTLGGDTVTVPQLLANLTMKPTTFHQPFLDTVYWTLNVELKFYALVLLVLLTRQMHNIERWLWVWLAVSVIATMSFAPAPIRYLSLDNYAAFFIAGCVFYLIRTRGLSAARIVALGVSLVVAELSAVRGQEGFTLHPQDWVSAWVAALIAVEFAVFYAVATRAWILRASPIWYALGGMTYPLYLIHSRAGDAVDGLLPVRFSGPEKATILITLALLVSYLLAVTVERRLCPAFNRLLTSRSHRLGGQLMTESAAAVAPVVKESKGAGAPTA